MPWVAVLGLDDGDGQVRRVVEDVVGALLLAARVQLAANNDPPLGEADFSLTCVEKFHPARCSAGVMYCAIDVAAGEFLFVRHAVLLRMRGCVRVLAYYASR